MAYYDEYSGMEVESEEERRKRLEEAKKADETVAAEHKVTTYENGSQTVETKQEVPASQGLQPIKPTFAENIGNAVRAMPQNFVNNVNRGLTNLQNAPGNFVSNVQALPDQFAAETERLKRIAGNQPVSPDQTTAETARLQRQAGVPAEPEATQAPQPTTAPAAKFDQAAYNASIAQQESGNRPDIGYHDKSKSSAFGLFGITAPAYADARRVNPNLPEDITKATSEQQTEAHNIITNNNARFLQSKGIEPTPGALSTSHLLGANGLYKYMTQKDEQGRPYLSPQAQQANGGYDNLARIVNGRLQGQAVPSSGAAQQTQEQQIGPMSPEQADQQARQFAQSLQQYAGPAYNSFDEFGNPVYSPEQAILQSHVDRFANAQGNPMNMLQIYQDTSVPEWMRRQAGKEVAKSVKDADNEQTATETLPTLNPKQLADVAQGKDKTGVGDWLQYLLFRHVGLTDLANAKGEELGIGHKWQTVTDDNGKNGLIKVSANGRPLEGLKDDGTSMSQAELISFATGGAAKGVHQAADVYKDPSGQVKGSFVLETRPGQTPVYKEVGTGRRATPAESAVLNKTGVAGTLEQQAASQQQKLGIRLQYEPIIAAATAGAKELGEANAKYGTNFAIAGYGAPGTPNAGKPILVDQTTNQIVQPNAQGQITATAGAVPQGGTAALATGEKLRGERSQAMNKILDEEVRPQAQAGDTVSSVRKQQFAIFDRPGIDANKIFGLANAAGEGENAQKFTMLRDLLSGVVARNSDGTPMNGEQLSQRFAGLNLTPAEKSALAEYNISNQKINAATLKQTAGPGAVSEPEQRVNRESNVDVTKIPALGAFNAMAQSQFDGDRARYKADWAATQTFGSALEMDKAWRKENQRLAENYTNIARERIKFINENGNTYNAVREGYRRFPVPEYDPATESWKKTKPLSSFNR